jgi:hypothetical protein
MPSDTPGTRTPTTQHPAPQGAKGQASGASATPTVKRTAGTLNRRQARAAYRAAVRRRRLQWFSGALAIIVVAALAVFIKDHWPNLSPNKSPTANACPTATTFVGPAAVETPPTTPPAVQGKTQTGDQGLQYVDIKEGCGPAAKAGDTVSVKYNGWVQSTGKLFDSSLNHASDPNAGMPGGVFTVPSPLGSDQPQVIQGWNMGLIGVKAGGVRRLIIPPALGYGNQANGPIPANATLIFDVTVVSISSAGS